MVTVKRALLSCYDKTGLEAFARALAGLDIELIASGGTAQELARTGLPVKSIEQFAGVAEQLDGRVKTLHPKVHAGILARRDDPAHVKAVGEAGLIDLVVVNLYPFQETTQRADARLEEAIEHIDVGGVALLRAAAKNFAHVAAVSSPSQYARVIEALTRGRGSVPQALARELATAAFEQTSAYDRAIAAYLSPEARETMSRAADDALPTEVTLRLRKRQGLRYGENPHQSGAWYTASEEPASGLSTLRQLQGKELSYNNLLDVDAALRCLLAFERPACVIVKHASPCGLASAAQLSQAYERALACDVESAFGGIVGVNRPVTAALARKLTEIFLEVIAAPSVDAEAAGLLAKKPNLRVVTLAWPQAGCQPLAWRQLLGGWLLQQADDRADDAQAFRATTKRAPTAHEREDLAFAWQAVRHVRSNAVILVQQEATVGIGQGQPSRVGSVRLAIDKAGARAQGAVAASDGFFPFPDGVELLARAGVTAVIQPGGSIQDSEVIAAADAAGVAMVFSGVRHFRHYRGGESR